MTYLSISTDRMSDGMLSRMVSAVVKPFRLQAEAELSTMDDRVLRDIGVPRDQVRNVACRHAEEVCG
jgi:hypothetical protein